MPQSNYPVQQGGPLPDGVVNILVLGSDARPGGGFRTDVIMLVSINRNNSTVSVVSFPRDLYVNIPGWMTNRINTAMQVGGFYTMQAHLPDQFRGAPDYYVMTNFNGFKGIIDSMDGIDVKVAPIAERQVRPALGQRARDTASIEAPAPCRWTATTRCGTCARATPPAISTACAARRKCCRPSLPA